jgi:hypothetical protein
VVVVDVAAAVDTAMMDAHRHYHRRYEYPRRIHFQPLAHHRRGMRMSECWREDYWNNTNIAVRLRRCIDDGCGGGTPTPTATPTEATSGRSCHQSESVVAAELGQAAS